MRDWNLITAIDDKETITFVAYLWGIETTQQQYETILSKVFVAYLWGIETCFCTLENFGVRGL